MATANDPAEPTYQGRPASYWIGCLVYTAMRPAAQEALCQLGKEAVPALLKARLDPNNRVREEAAAVLGMIEGGAGGGEGSRARKGLPGGQ
jgi:HEAT repeat protein